MPFWDAVSVGVWIRAFNQPFLRKDDGSFFGWKIPKQKSLMGPKFQDWLSNSKIWVKARFIMIDRYFWSVDCYYCNLQRLDWPPYFGKGRWFFHLNLSYHVHRVSQNQVILRLFPNGVSVASQGTLLDRIFSATWWRSLEGIVCLFFVVWETCFLGIIGWDTVEVTWDHFVLFCSLFGDDDVLYAQFNILFVTVVVVWRGPGFNYLWYVCIVGVSYTRIHKLYDMCIHVQYTMCLRQRSSIQYLQTGHKNRTCGFLWLWNTLRVHATYSFWYQTALVIGLIPFLALNNPRFLLDKHCLIQIQTSSQGEWSRSWWSSPLPWISVLRSQRVTTLAERHMGWYCMGISWLKHGCVCMSSHCLKSGSSRSTSGITYAWLTL